MANYCWYEMKIKGTRNNCNKWLKKMESYDEANHFWRMFAPVNIDDEGGTDDAYYMILSGDCAWSLESCCRSSGYSNGVDLFSENTRDLNIIMEAYSQEPGIGFQEHYVYDKGECIEDECEDWMEIYWDKSEYDSLNDFKEDCKLLDHITEEDFDEDGYYHSGGFPEWVFTI